MKISKISQQLKQTNRYSIFIDDEYSFSLSETALLESGLASNRELTPQEIADFKQLSKDDKVYGLALKYVAMRQHTIWEVRSYMERKGASPQLAEQVIAKLMKLGLLDDYKYAESFARDRRLLRSSSRRKIVAELRKKRVADSAIQAALGSENDDELSALGDMIARKRRQTKYQDDLKLMQYLARQGFGYDDIKRAMNSNDEDL